MKIYGKISHLDGFSNWDFFMGNCTILVIELFHLKMGKWATLVLVFSFLKLLKLFEYFVRFLVQMKTLKFAFEIS